MPPSKKKTLLAHDGPASGTRSKRICVRYSRAEILFHNLFANEVLVRCAAEPSKDWSKEWFFTLKTEMVKALGPDLKNELVATSKPTTWLTFLFKLVQWSSKHDNLAGDIDWIVSVLEYFQQNGFSGYVGTSHAVPIIRQGDSSWFCNKPRAIDRKMHFQQTTTTPFGLPQDFLFLAIRNILVVMLHVFCCGAQEITEELATRVLGPCLWLVLHPRCEEVTTSSGPEPDARALNPLALEQSTHGTPIPVQLISMLTIGRVMRATYPEKLLKLPKSVVEGVLRPSLVVLCESILSPRLDVVCGIYNVALLFPLLFAPSFCEKLVQILQALKHGPYTQHNLKIAFTVVRTFSVLTAHPQFKCDAVVLTLCSATHEVQDEFSAHGIDQPSLLQPFSLVLQHKPAFAAEFFLSRRPKPELSEQALVTVQRTSNSVSDATQHLPTEQSVATSGIQVAAPPTIATTTPTAAEVEAPPVAPVAPVVPAVEPVVVRPITPLPAQTTPPTAPAQPHIQAAGEANSANPTKQNLVRRQVANAFTTEALAHCQGVVKSMVKQRHPTPTPPPFASQVLLPLWDMLADVTLIVGKDPKYEFRCHRVVLVCASPYFSALLTSPYFKEAENGDRVLLPDLPATLFHKALQWIYFKRTIVVTDDAPEFVRLPEAAIIDNPGDTIQISVFDAAELLLMADFLGLMILAESLEAQLCQHINQETVDELTRVGLSLVGSGNNCGVWLLHDCHVFAMSNSREGFAFASALFALESTSLELSPESLQDEETCKTRWAQLAC